MSLEFDKKSCVPGCFQEDEPSQRRGSRRVSCVAL